MGEHFLGVLRLAGRHAHHFRAAERVDDAKRQGQHHAHSLWEKASVVGDVVHAGGVVSHVRAGACRPYAHDDEQHDHRDFDGGEPELRFTEHFDTQHVDDEHDRKHGEGNHPLRHGIEHGPILEIQRRCRGIGHQHGRPHDVVEPAGEIRALLTEELARIRHDRSR